LLLRLLLLLSSEQTHQTGHHSDLGHVLAAWLRPQHLQEGLAWLCCDCC
jgi:hypothetical protein